MSRPSRLPWFLDFADGHVERHPREDWGPVDSVSFAAWEDAFHRRNVSEDTAVLASIRLVENSPKYLNEHLPELLKLCDAITHQRKTATVGTREEADRGSWNCLDCSGAGLTHRYQHAIDPGSRVIFFCTCPKGRWLASTHRSKPSDVTDRIPDLADFPKLHLRRVEWSDTLDSPWRYHPDAWDYDADRPRKPTADYRSDLAARNATVNVRDVLKSRPKFLAPPQPLETLDRGQA